MIKVIIADDHAIVRQGIVKILEKTGDINVLDEASNGRELLEKIRMNSYNVLVLDLNMPGRSGLDLISDVLSYNPAIAILVLSVSSEKQIVLNALKQGAMGFMTKESAPEELIEAIRIVNYGEKYISKTLAGKLVIELTESGGDKPHEKLSPREYQTLCMIGNGLPMKQIAGDMNLSIKTISTYRTRILEKLHLSNNYELMQYVMKNNLGKE